MAYGMAWIIAATLFAGDTGTLLTQASKSSGSKGYNYRDSGSGRYMKKDAAQRRPPATVEKERRRSK